MYTFYSITVLMGVGVVILLFSKILIELGVDFGGTAIVFLTHFHLTNFLVFLRVYLF